MVGEPGWATQASSAIFPPRSPRVAPAMTGWPAVTRTSSLASGRGWFCPRTNSTVILRPPRQIPRWFLSVIVPPAAGRTHDARPPARAAGPCQVMLFQSLTGPAGADNDAVIAFSRRQPPNPQPAAVFRGAHPTPSTPAVAADTPIARQEAVPVCGPQAYRCWAIAGIRSWKVRPLHGVPSAAICQPPPSPRKTFAMIWAVYWPPPVSV